MCLRAGWTMDTPERFAQFISLTTEVSTSKLSSHPSSGHYIFFNYSVRLILNSLKNFKFFFFSLCIKMFGTWRKIIFNNYFLSVCVSGWIDMHDNLRTKSRVLNCLYFQFGEPFRFWAF